MSIFRNHNMLTVNEGINRSRTDKNAVMIDIRSKEEYGRGYVAGTINIPMDKLELAQTRIRDKNTVIYIMGSYENNPKKAARKLKKYGFKNVVPSGVFEEHHGILKKK